MYKKLLAMLAFICTLGACTTTSTDKTVTLRSVKLTHPILLSNETTKTFSGIVKEANEINLGFKTAGQIETIYVKQGDYIKKGQLVAKLDTKDYKLDTDVRQVQYDQAKKEVGRLQKLYHTNSLSGNDYEKAEAQLKALEAQLQLSKNTLEYTILESPVNGYVQSVNFEKAEMVDAGTSVINLINVEHMEVECEIPASMYIKRNLFSSSYCFSSLLPNEKYSLQLMSIVPKADGNQLYKVKYMLNTEAMKKLTAGMNVEIDIYISDTTQNGNRFTLPLKSIFNETNKSYVWVLQSDSTVSKCNVTINGIDGNGDAIVEAPLKETDNIVKAGTTYLNENEKVCGIGEPDKTNVGGLL